MFTTYDIATAVSSSCNENEIIHWSSVKDSFPSLVTLFEPTSFNYYSIHSSLNLSLFTCGSNA